MSHPIELPGEANPLSEQFLVDALRSAASSDQAQVKKGTKQLQKWEVVRGYHGLLQDAYFSQALPLELRMLAIIQLKNGVDKYWRKSANNAIRPDEREKIRSRLLEAGINETNVQLNSMNALVAAKVARFDFPLQWPDMIKTIILLLQRAMTVEEMHAQLPRVLLTLHHIIKELATIRLARSKSSLQAVTPELLSILRNIYVQKVQFWEAALLGPGSVPNESIIAAMNDSLKAIKILRRLILAGFEFPSKSKEVADFWEITKGHMILGLRVATSGSGGNAQLFAMKHVVQYGKFHLDMARSHPTSFVFLPETISLLRDYWAYAKELRSQLATQNLSNEELYPSFEKYIVISLSLLRSSIKLVFSPPAQAFKYRHVEDKEEPEKARKLILNELFTDAFVIGVLEVLVSQYFMLLPADLEEWTEEPEAWDMKLEGDEDAYDIFVRPCAERLFLDITVHFRKLIVQPLLDVFAKVTAPNFEDIIVKDAVYSAIGLAANTLHEHVDIDGFLKTSVVAEMQKTTPHAKIIRRRVAIILAQWVPVQIAQESRPLVYQIYQHLLDKTNQLNDPLVRLTAGKRFKAVADGWDFSPEAFAPFAPDIFSRLIDLIAEVEFPESKLALVSTVSVLIERNDEYILPYVASIVASLPTLWMESGEQHLMKQAILVVFERLIKALKGARAAPLFRLIMPIINAALAPNSDSRVYLLEDALELWHTVVQHSEEPVVESVTAIMPLLLPEFQSASENLLKVLEISESYLWLTPSAMLADGIREQMLSAWATLLDVVKPHHVQTVTNLIELMIRGADALGSNAAGKIVTSSLLDCGILTKIIVGLKGNWEAHQTSGPHRKDPIIDTVCETKYLAVLSRIILADDGLNLMFEALRSIGEDYGDDIDTMMKWLLSEWFSHMDYVGSPVESKLLCLALTKLLESGQAWILNRLQELMTVWTSVAAELRKSDDETSKGTDSLLYTEEQAQMEMVMSGASLDEPESQRRLQGLLRDIVHRVNVNDSIHHYLGRAISSSGGQQAFHEQWLVNVDQDVLKSFGVLGIV